MLREKVEEWIHGLLRPFGVDLRRYTPINFPNLRRARILEHGKVSVVLDVGASTGQYGARLRMDGYKGHIHSFEPRSAAFDELRRRVANDARWTCHQTALGDEEGQRELRVSANSVSSSFLDAAERMLEVLPGARPIGRETVPIQRLDSLLGGLELDDETVMLKLDVQGFEMNVLRGARALLGRAAVVESELSLMEMYRGETSFMEIIEHLVEAGLELASVEPNTIDPTTSRLLEINGIFVRTRAPALFRGVGEGV